MNPASASLNSASVVADAASFAASRATASGGAGAATGAMGLGDDGSAGAYAARLLDTPEYLEWEHGALTDERVLTGSL